MDALQLIEFSQTIKAKLIEAQNKYQLNENFHQEVDIRFDLKGRSTIAYAYGKDAQNRYKLNFNMEACVHYLEDVKGNTIPHEIAHLVCYAKPELGGKGHNKVWRQICKELGGDGSRVTSIDYSDLKPARKTKKYIYATTDDHGHAHQMILKANRHNKFQRGQWISFTNRAGVRFYPSDFLKMEY